MLLMNPDPAATPYAGYQTQPPSRPSTARQSALLATSPSSPQTEEAVRSFMFEVGDVSGFIPFPPRSFDTGLRLTFVGGGSRSTRRGSSAS